MTGISAAHPCRKVALFALQLLTVDTLTMSCEVILILSVRFWNLRMSDNISADLFHDIWVKVRRQDSSYQTARLGDFNFTYIAFSCLV